MAASTSVRAELLFGARCGRQPQGTVFCPGRAILMRRQRPETSDELLIAPTSQGISAVWGIRPDRRVAVWAMDAGAKDHFSHGETSRSGRLWSDLARGASARLENQGWRPPGIDMVLIGDLPQKMGLASSTAYAAAVLRCFYAAIEEPRATSDLARDIAWVERRWGRPALYDTDAQIVANPQKVLTHLRPKESFDDHPTWPLRHRVTGHGTTTVRPDFDDDADALDRAIQTLGNEGHVEFMTTLNGTTSLVFGADHPISAMRAALMEEPHVDAVRIHPVGETSGLIGLTQASV